MDLVRDPRMLWNVPMTKKKAKALQFQLERSGRAISENVRPLLFLTFDIERDQLPSVYEGNASQTAEVFLRQINSHFLRRNWRGTFFVQGNMIERLSVELQNLSNNGNIIALHGYNHELWGTNNWKTRYPPITHSERSRRLDAAISVFDKCRLPKPLAFRAPNFTIDQFTYHLLEDHGFIYDSSNPSQRSGTILPNRVGQIRVVPVSTAPIPRLYKNTRLGVYTAAQYRQFNFDIFVNSTMDDFRNDVSSVLQYHLFCEIRPHIVMYAHNWEFYRQPDNNAVDGLVARTERLIEEFDMSLCTIDQAATADIWGQG